jgi:hypothetical protein
MKFSIKTLFAVAAFGAFATTSCSEKKAENAVDATANAADQAGNAVENAVDSAKADIAREPGDTAIVRDQPADKIVEETPAKQK